MLSWVGYVFALAIAVAPILAIRGLALLAKRKVKQGLLNVAGGIGDALPSAIVFSNISAPVVELASAAAISIAMAIRMVPCFSR